MDKFKLPEVDEEILKKLPYWKRWLYDTLRELRRDRNRLWSIAPRTTTPLSTHNKLGRQ